MIDLNYSLSSLQILISMKYTDRFIQLINITHFHFHLAILTLAFARTPPLPTLLMSSSLLPSVQWLLRAAGP